MPEPRFTIHARHQMHRRSISTDEVSEALDATETTYTSRQHPERLVVVFGPGRLDASRWW